MTDKILPPAPEAAITLDRKRTLRADLQAMRLFKRETGISILRGELRADTIDEDNLCALLWAFLVHDDPELSIDAVATMLTPSNMYDALILVTDVLKEAMPQPEEEGQGEGEEDHPLEVTTEETRSTS